MTKESIGKPSIAEQPAFQQFIADRGIAPADFHLIDALATFPKDMINEGLHNIFNTYHEESAEELERMAENATGERKELYAAALQFCRVYGWAASWNLERLLERP